MHNTQTKNDKIRTWIEKCPSYCEIGAAFLREMQEVLDGQATGNTEIGPAVGKIIGMKEKFDKRKRPSYYCTVKWADGRTSEHAQHMLTPAP